MDTDIEVSDQGLTSARPCSRPALPAAHPIGRAADLNQRHRACGFVWRTRSGAEIKQPSSVSAAMQQIQVGKRFAVCRGRPLRL